MIHGFNYPLNISHYLVTFSLDSHCYLVYSHLLLFHTRQFTAKMSMYRGPSGLVKFLSIIREWMLWNVLTSTHACGHLFPNEENKWVVQSKHYTGNKWVDSIITLHWKNIFTYSHQYLKIHGISWLKLICWHPRTHEVDVLLWNKEVYTYTKHQNNLIF